MWPEEDNRLRKEFTFKDFRDAFAFMTDVAEIAERMDHHPTWTNVYNKVTFELFTFDAGNTVTHRDHRLAEAIDEAASRYQGQ